MGPNHQKILIDPRGLKRYAMDHNSFESKPGKSQYEEISFSFLAIALGIGCFQS